MLRVVSMWAKGMGATNIAEILNAESVPTPSGGVKWWPSYVSRLLRTQDARRLIESGIHDVASHVGMGQRRSEVQVKHHERMQQVDRNDHDSMGEPVAAKTARGGRRAATGAS